MNLTFRENYWDSPELKQEFIAFLNKIHNLDLSLWDEMGFWDHRYRPFSYFDGPNLVSSLCVYSMDMTINGERRRVAQVSGVGTLEEHRRKGLNLELTEKAIAWAKAEHDFFFLFADEGARPFYKRCGFRPVLEHKARVSITGKAASRGARKLDMTSRDDIDLVFRLASEREPVSGILGVNNPKLLMFWCLYFFSENVFYISELDTLILYERQNDLLTVHDIVGKKIPPFDEIYPYISSDDDKAVEFSFMTDKLDLGGREELLIVESNGTRLFGDVPFEGSKFLFPITAHA